MTYILVLLLIFFGFLCLIMWGSMWYMRVLLDLIIGRKMRDLETLTATGTIPEQWSTKYTERMIRWQELGDEVRLKRVQRASRRFYLNKISKLTAYVKKTNLLQNEDSRNHTLRILQRVECDLREAN
ncbi:hypothetical protein EHS13_17570 [Paenibacillus psychroresistens]|uniref:Uncharacterized protein n=1 Tax=Paenibacillus psychroresistens TaxID=1778678 RepID=A0A6B8RJB8_9BACL|nr:hypothetical protein [Paenibacillus psychroresistens]QGQ96561.1 hypothetical protein EHS13_17570 [Paenibacillus psychroresistens]